MRMKFIKTFQLFSLVAEFSRIKTSPSFLFLNIWACNSSQSCSALNCRSRGRAIEYAVAPMAWSIQNLISLVQVISEQCSTATKTQFIHSFR